MLFPDAEILSYDQKSQYFGGEIIRYRSTKDISVQGNLLTLTNSSGVSGILSGIAAIESAANDWQSFIINGVDFGSGTITSISFDEGLDVRTKKYTIELSIPESGSINNLPTNDSYSGISYNGFKFIDSLTESLSLSRNFEKDNYSHSVDIKIGSSNITGSINQAKGIAKNLYESNSFNGYIGNYYGLSGKKSTYEESYDKINGECSFNQSTDYLSNVSGNYSVNKTYTYNRETDGVVTVSEKGEIKAIVEPYLEVLTNAYLFESASSASNCNTIFLGYKEADTYSLNLIPLVKGTSLSRYEKMLSYDHSYSNNLSINDLYFWQYTHESSLDSDGEITTTENGSIIGRGHRVDLKYNAANLAYTNLNAAIESRSKSAYDRYRTFITLPNTSAFALLKRNETYKKHIGQIEYNWEYSNDSTLVVGDPFINQSKVTVSEEFQLPLSSNYNIFNYGEIEQVSASYKVSAISAKVELRGKRNTTMDYYLNYAKSVAAPYAADFLMDASYSLSPFSNSFNLNVDWGKIYEA